MWIKVCGIRDVDSAEGVARLGPDAIGLNFWSGSPRFVSASDAAEIVERVSGTVEPVGLFVDHPLEELTAVLDLAGIESVQLHGEESPEYLAALRSARPLRRLIRAMRVGNDGLQPVAEYLDACATAGGSPDICLLDARVPGTPGGTGRTLDWNSLAPPGRSADWPPLVLAGGLTPQNIAEAVSSVRPWGVDVASGVESLPGVKDLGAVERFIAAARAAGAKAGGDAPGRDDA